MGKNRYALRHPQTVISHCRGIFLPSVSVSAGAEESIPEKNGSMPPADYRGQGISEVMYAEAEKDIAAKFPGSRITLRTWSTNGAQEHILDKLGYSLVRRLKDDRGEGIDTVYFVKKEENDR